MSSFWNEVRIALRSLRRAPLYSTLAIVTAAVGIGASTAIFSVAKPIVFDAAPYPSPDKLVMMANQIGRFFASQGEETAAPGIAEHIKKFWEPRMRSAIFAHLDAGGAGLDPVVKTALESLRQKA